ncbi:ABC transporter, ATP-binding protein domain containing protein [Theileria equi strain WA]|uniref:ABC transporter, ATP-binding protein domain containing protein n=1 Tax=Theileria equi strain WA TaxID=1537102 RepID=L1LG18_THEEQ|nr:ABC transporter, ATP-binding protein domain containing protein [Theileria equi strain WA]EKX74214.1 ABC transporter, ATP-binding protein domain containing protein [Theileria equi strain WA]|eukprot:XP_004833666.1 ABC transporter, ATP-binding protein domain containing protein [Theileria equi strain WA]
MEEDTKTLETTHHFWESEVELVRKKTKAPNGKKFRYFDDKGILNFVFLLWMYRWIRETSKRYLDPYMLHPLPLADQLLIWQPILSKHISDGIASLEAYEALSKEEKKSAKKPVKYILLRALLLTFWKRLLLILVAIVVMNAINMSVPIFLHRLLNLLSEKDFNFMTFLSLALSIIIIELFKEICMEHINYYLQRLSCVIDSCLRATIVQHGLCYRRSTFGHFSDSHNSCKSAIHCCSGKDACTDNPLLCPARRYKNNEINPKVFTLALNQPRHVPFTIECIAGIIDFLTAFTYGLIVISQQLNMKAMNILIVSIFLVLCIIAVEVTNGFLFLQYFGIRDARIDKSEEVLSSLPLIKRMLLDDIGHDIVMEVRNDELTIIAVRFFLALFSKVIMASITCINIIILVNDFVTQVKDATDVKDINPSGLLASIFVIMKIISPLYMVPFKLKLLAYAICGIINIEKFLKSCSPNFYIPDNKFTGKTTLPDGLPAEDKTLPKGLVVMFKKASFAWINSRKDLLDNTGTTCLRDLDFVLNSGDLAIITGAQGSGKSNFVKAILGDMTLVEGSMAVLPLSTNMPIFYASQDVWLQKGTIMSNITFGHRFDEELYNTVLKAIELEHDISTWEGGDMRKISEHGYSLSGGQRVRIGLARAIYSYLIFSKTSREENNAKCSFLVVLDDCFTSLDPFVAKTIFKNLFNVNDGLLAKGDVSTVLTISKRILEACVSSESPDLYPDAPIYALENNTLIQENKLKSLIEHEVGHLEPPKPSEDIVKLQPESSDILRRCSSDNYTRDGRKISTGSWYSDSPTVQALYDKNNLKNSRNKGFWIIGVYFRAVGWPIIFFFIFSLTFTILDSTKFIITSKVSDSVLDYAKEHKGAGVSLEDVKKYCIKALRWIVLLSVAVMVGALLRIISMTKSSLNASCRLYEYCINSLFLNSSAVIKIKRSLGNVLTFLYMDTLSIDNTFNYFLHDIFLLLIEASVHLLTLLFLVPWATPLAFVICFIVIRFIAYHYIKSSQHVSFARMETFNILDSTIESAISGLPIYRSFKKEWEFMHNTIEHVEYNIRCLYFCNSSVIWSAVTFKCLLSPLALFILVFPLVRSRLFDIEIKIGYYAMAYSIFLTVNTYFTNFLKLYYFFEMCRISIGRFENFVPPNTPVKFTKKRDIHRTDIVVDHSEKDSTDKDALLDDLKKSIRMRRNLEYNSKRPVAFTRFRMLFFKHKVNVFDVSEYVTPGHNRIKLDNVSVYITSTNDTNEYAILKNVTCSANTSDIIGIVGRTGAGKSTLLSVLQGLARNRDGSVLLDGCDLNDMPKNVTRQIIGVLPQLPFVFRGWTVRRFIDPRMLFDDTNIEMALENCGLLKFVENLSGGKGLDTVIIPDHYHRDLPKYLKRAYYGPDFKSLDGSLRIDVDRGMTLSNSQLRTLSVARLVLYREFFKVLLVDEPPEDESGASKTADIPIYELIKTHFQHCTTFIAAHNTDVLRLCTSIWVFHNGTLTRTCKTEDIVDSSSLSKIIEDCILEQ